MKVTFIILLLLNCWNFDSYSQEHDKVSSTVIKINALVEQKNIGQGGTAPERIAIDTNTIMIQFNDFIIPLEQVRLFYKYHNNEDNPQIPMPREGHQVIFYCNDTLCIKFRSKFMAAYGTFFKSKKDCAEFISLISDLRTVLSK